MMKKTVSLLSGLALMFGMGISGAFASESVPVPGLVYNTEEKQIENIQNVNGRVMLPFRAVFEMMGATVDYENETRKITAVRGDKTVEFFADGTSIKVTDPSGVTEIPAEIGFDYERDRVMVPVRFVSNALGARVGWNDDEKCVYVLDTYSLLESLKKDCPDFFKYAESSAKLQKNIKSTSDLSFGFSGTFESIPVKANLKASAAGSTYDNKGTTALKLDFTHENLSSLIDYNLGTAEKVTLDAIKTEDALYFKTNAAAKIPGLLPEETTLHLAEKVISENDWFRLDYSYVEELFGKVMADALFKGTEQTAENVFLTLGDISSMYQSAGDVTFGEMYSVKAYFDNLKAVFSKAVFTALGDDDFTFALDVDTAEWIKNTIKREDFATEEEYQLALGMMSSVVCKLKASVAVKDGIVENETVNFEMNMKGIPNTENISIVMDISGKSEKLKSAPEIKIPENSVSIKTMMTLLNSFTR